MVYNKSFIYPAVNMLNATETVETFLRAKYYVQTPKIKNKEKLNEKCSAAVDIDETVK